MKYVLMLEYYKCKVSCTVVYSLYVIEENSFVNSLKLKRLSKYLEKRSNNTVK